MAYRLNAPCPPAAPRGPGRLARRALLSSGLEGTTRSREVVKRCEDADALILRLYEGHNRRGGSD